MSGKYRNDFNMYWRTTHPPMTAETLVLPGSGRTKAPATAADFERRKRSQEKFEMGLAIFLECDAMCHERQFAPQQTALLFDQLVGNGEQLRI